MIKLRRIRALAFVVVAFYSLVLVLHLREIRRTHDSLHKTVENQFMLDVRQKYKTVDNWRFSINKFYESWQLHKWRSPPQIPLHPTQINEQGENGTAYIPQSHEIPLINQSFATNNFNLYASDQISLRRTLPDLRFKECHKKQYSDTLPRASVVIVLHNEPWSTLLRTLWSVIDRSPHDLVEEIILVDDFSNLPHLFHPLEQYIKMFSVNIRIWRNDQREGLIRSRLIGAKLAKGSVLVFLDAHIEVNVGWLQPLLERLAEDRSVVTVPQIGFIRKETMDYKVSAGSRYIPLNDENLIDFIGLRWNLQFYWTKIPEREKIRNKYDQTAPIRILTHIGCAFAVDREFFFEIGAYDESMAIWGSENVELAFRVWQCGGSLELIPCSHIGHLFRLSKYSFNGNKDIIKWRNNVRLAEVWMDDMKDLFYAASPDHKKVTPEIVGDLNDRIELRRRLKCRSFRWLLENVYPEHSMLKKYLFIGEIRNEFAKKCLDIIVTDTSEQQSQLFGCHGSGLNQFFAFATNGQIITIEERFCTGVLGDGVSVGTVVCSVDDESQFWKYEEVKQWIRHMKTGLCMSVNSNDIDVQLASCVESGSRAAWTLKPTLGR